MTGLPAGLVAGLLFRLLGAIPHKQRYDKLI
jgi:hypothetical protein